MQETARIQALNDAFRRRLIVFNELIVSGDLVVTTGVASQGNDFLKRAIKIVKEFSDFNEDNDPYGEHDYGSFVLDGQKLLWKIDYYDQRCEFGSENPADVSRTRRVLTILLLSEY